MIDARYKAMLDRFRTLATHEIRRIQVALDRGSVCFDTYNRDPQTGKFCPVAIAMGLDAQCMTDAEVAEAIGRQFQPVNILKGVPGEFYTTDRRRDLVNLCKFVLNERASREPWLRKTLDDAKAAKAKWPEWARKSVEANNVNDKGLWPGGPDGVEGPEGVDFAQMVTRKSLKICQNALDDSAPRETRAYRGEPVFCLRGWHQVCFREAAWAYRGSQGQLLGSCENCKKDLTRSNL